MLTHVGVYNRSLEPLWACGDMAASPQALRSTVYGKALTQGSDNSFYDYLYEFVKRN